MKLQFEKLSSPYIEWARQLHNDPSVLNMLTDPHIITKKEQLKWFEKLEQSNSSQRILVSKNYTPIGIIRLDQIDYYNKSVCAGLDIHKNYRGQGLARPIYEYIFREWFVIKQFHRIWLVVAAYNTHAIRLYYKLGFKKEGEQVEALYKDGKFYNQIIMGMIKK